MLKSEVIENFNTLLDESNLLTLSNGTRLKVHDNLKILMETPHLGDTSPATITRCFVHFVCDRDVVRDELIGSQLPQTMSSEQAKRISKLFEKLTNAEIVDVGKLYKIMLSSKLAKFEGEWQ